MKPIRSWIAGALACLGAMPMAWAQPAAAGDTLARLQAGQGVTLGVRSSAPPFAMVDAQGHPAGFSWELCQEVVRRLSTQIGRPIEMKIVPVTLAESFDLLRIGGIDLQCGGTTHTAERARQVDFSVTFFVSGVAAAYRKTDQRMAADREFGRAGVLAGSTAERAMQVRQPRKSMYRIEAVTHVANYSDGVRMLKAGEIDTLVADAVLLPDDADIGVRRQFLTVEPYGLMMRKGDTAFVQAVDEALKAVLTSPLAAQLAAKAGLRVNPLTREAWRKPGKQIAPPSL